MRRLVAILGAAMLVAVSCSSSSTGGGASPSAAASDTPQQGGRIIEPTTSDIATIQPVLSNDTASARVINLIYDSLLL
ncbi:MAG TPA: hypothetical protein VGS17_06290, partial [Candidatus Limnocylindria bacterium]|nr:hypothetical protein [Candidatus Limnocylindria bacterium]